MFLAQKDLAGTAVAAVVVLPYAAGDRATDLAARAARPGGVSGDARRGKEEQT